MSKNIDQLYKEKFDNFEAPVSEGLWDKIEQNPKWKKHLQKQKMRDLSIYAGLAIVAIGSCLVLLLHQPDSMEPTQNASTEELSDEVPTLNSEKTISDISSNENTVAKEKNSENLVEPKSETVPSTQTTSENTVTDPTINNTIGSEKTVPGSDNENSHSSEKQNTTIEPPADNKKASESQVQNENAVSPESTDSPVPAPENNTPPNSSLFSIPNAFTPNGDGLNDIFKPVTAAEIINYQLDIFTTNGQHVFSSKNIEFGWNGEFQGGLVNAGTYIYVIKYKDDKGKEHIDKGQLLLIR